MHRHDLMALRGGPDEYESEALSVLSRFNESALGACEDRTTLEQVSCGIVRQAFEFWFTETPPDVTAMVHELLEAYLGPEQPVSPEVHSAQ